LEWLSDSVKHEFFQHAPVFTDKGLRDFDILHNISILGGFELCVSHLFDHQELIVSANARERVLITDGLAEAPHTV